MAKNVRINPATGELDYYFPMEITDPSVREYAEVYGLEIGWAKLGFRDFQAVFVPCKDRVYDPRHGMDVYIDTPSDVQRRRYLELIKDEMNWQEAEKQDGRCIIPDGRGGTKRCPLRAPNPDYVPDGYRPKTISVRCEGCIFEEFRQAHTFVEFSALSDRDEEGETSYEPASPSAYHEVDRFLRVQDAFCTHIEKQAPKLYALAERLLEGYSQSEAARLLGKSTSTVGDQTKKLRELLEDFLNSALVF